MQGGWVIPKPLKWVDIIDKPPVLEDSIVEWSEIQNKPTIEELKGDKGDIGPMPNHQWSATALRFQTSLTTWGDYVDLRGPAGATGATGLQGPSVGVLIEPTPLATAPAPVPAYYYFTANASDGYPADGLLVSGLHQSASRSTQLAIRRDGNQAFFRAAISGAWQEWSEIYNSRNLIVGTLSHTFTGNLFTGNVGDYRYSDSPFTRYCLTFNAFASATASSGYRFRNAGFAFWIDQRSSNGDIWFNSSTTSGNANDAITVRTLFQFQTSTNRLLFSQRLNLANLPTSATGLASGDLWRDTNGFLRIV